MQSQYATSIRDSEKEDGFWREGLNAPAIVFHLCNVEAWVYTNSFQKSEVFCLLQLIDLCYYKVGKRAWNIQGYKRTENKKLVKIWNRQRKMLQKSNEDAILALYYKYKAECLLRRCQNERERK